MSGAATFDVVLGVCELESEEQEVAKKRHAIPNANIAVRRKTLH